MQLIASVGLASAEVRNTTLSSRLIHVFLYYTLSMQPKLHIQLTLCLSYTKQASCTLLKAPTYLMHMRTTKQRANRYFRVRINLYNQIGIKKFLETIFLVTTFRVIHCLQATAVTRLYHYSNTSSKPTFMDMFYRTILLFRILFVSKQPNTIKISHTNRIRDWSSESTI